jgi:hypothetical protein
LERLTEEAGHDAASGGSTLLGNLLYCKEDLVVDIESGSHSLSIFHLIRDDEIEIFGGDEPQDFFKATNA